MFKKPLLSLVEGRMLATKSDSLRTRSSQSSPTISSAHAFLCSDLISYLSTPITLVPNPFLATLPQVDPMSPNPITHSVLSLISSTYSVSQTLFDYFSMKLLTCLACQSIPNAMNSLRPPHAKPLDFVNIMSELAKSLALRQLSTPCVKECTQFILLEFIA